MAQRTLEERMDVIESTVAAIVARGGTRPAEKDWRRTVGMFEGDAVIEAIQLEGRRIREAERRAAQEGSAP